MKRNPDRMTTARLVILAICAAAMTCGCGSDEPKQKKKPQKGHLPAKQQEARRNANDQGYLGVTIGAKYHAEREACSIRLKSLYRELRMREATGDGYPAKLEDLRRPDMCICPLDRMPYMYVPGQNGNSHAQNVLIYEDAPAHEGKAFALLAGGTVARLTADQLKAALQETYQRLGP